MNHSKGFTLIEMMIVVIIIGILAAIAIPSYNEYYRKKDRSVAQSEMMKLATELERHRAKNFTYRGFDAGYIYTGVTGANYNTGSATLSVPIDSEAKKYNIRIVSTNNQLLTHRDADGFAWTIIATRRDMEKQAQNYDLMMKSDGTRCMTKTANQVTAYGSCGTDNSETW